MRLSAIIRYASLASIVLALLMSGTYSGDPARAQSNPTPTLTPVGGSGAATPSAPVDAPVLFNPTGVATRLRPTYEWQRIEGATSYALVVVDAADSKQVLFETFPITVCDAYTFNICRATPSTTLSNNKQYIWYAAAYVGEGAGPWSAASSFQVSLLPPAPEENEPSGTIGAQIPTYRWAPVADAVYYSISVYENKTTTNVFFQTFKAEDVCSASGCSVTPGESSAPNPQLGTGKTYAWFVSATTLGGNGPWSSGAVFTVVANTWCLATPIVPEGQPQALSVCSQATPTRAPTLAPTGTPTPAAANTDRGNS